MGCKNPEQCRLKAVKHEKIQLTQALIGQSELELFRQHMQEGDAELNFDSHADRRGFFRAFSKYQILEALENGWCIERNIRDGKTVLLIMYYLKINHNTFRPIHVVCRFANVENWTILTVYDPRTKNYKWKDNYQKRICFCKNQKEEEDDF